MTTPARAGQESKRSRLMVDISPDLRRRIRVAAAREDLSVRVYVERLLQEAVPDDAQNHKPRSIAAPALEQLRQAREAVMRGRCFVDDSSDILRETRDERLAQL